MAYDEDVEVVLAHPTGATAATFTRTIRLELPTGATSISSRPHRQRDFRLLSASATSLRMVEDDMLKATEASSIVSSTRQVLTDGHDRATWSYSNAVQTATTTDDRPRARTPAH